MSTHQRENSEHRTQLISVMKTVCEKVERGRETRRPNRDRHTKAWRNPHTDTLSETWVVTERENRGDY